MYSEKSLGEVRKHARALAIATASVVRIQFRESDYYLTATGRNSFFDKKVKGAPLCSRSYRPSCREYNKLLVTPISYEIKPRGACSLEWQTIDANSVMKPKKVSNKYNYYHEICKRCINWPSPEDIDMDYADDCCTKHEMAVYMGNREKLAVTGKCKYFVEF